MKYERLSEYRIMWLFVFFDLPTTTAEERSTAGKFRRNLLRDGFTMFQYSIYKRPCGSRENMNVHIENVRSFFPPGGFVAIMNITDKQFGMMELYYGGKRKQVPTFPPVFEMY
jgi:CRISPR-associated protein Cas2